MKSSSPDFSMDWNGMVEWTGLDWTGMEWNGMAGCNFVINFVGVTKL